MEVSSLFPPSGSQKSNYVIRLDDRHLYTLSLAPKTDFLELFTFLVAVTLSNKSGVGKDVYISSQHEGYSPSWQAGHGDRRVRWRVKLPYAARKQREREMPISFFSVLIQSGITASGIMPLAARWVALFS